VVGEDTEDLGEVWINYIRELCHGKITGKLRVAADPMMRLVNTILLVLVDRVEVAFNVLSLVCKFSILANLDWISVKN
jgi:hypothetical protein